MAFLCCPHHQWGRWHGRIRCTSALQQPGAATPVSDCAHSAPRDLFLILFPHHLFLTLCASHITKSTASAANLWSSVICFVDFLPKVTICSTTVQYLSLQIFTHGSSPQLLNGINGLHKDLPGPGRKTTETTSSFLLPFYPWSLENVAYKLFTF